MADNKVVPLDTGPDVEATRGPTVTESGLSENVSQLIESPEQMMKRVLLPGEVVRSEFECYFPTDFVPRWKIIMLLTITLGLYAFVLLYKSILKWCYKNKCCTPAIVSFTRGKLAITSKGRIICWNEFVSQVKTKEGESGCIAKLCCPELARPPVNYTTEMKTAVFSATKIRQISEIYTSSALCCCCCVDYDCMVEVSFENFRPSSDSFVKCQTKWDFYGMIQNILNTGVAAAESSVGISSSNANVLYIVSGTEDVVHNGDIHSVLTELTHLYSNIIQALPGKALPDVFVNTTSGDVECQKPTIADHVKGVTIVSDDQKVTIPSQWLSLLPGEEVICSYGEMFRMTCGQWISTLLTCGLQYCMVYRKEKYLRYGVVLTTKRVIVLDIYHRAGAVPDHLANVSCAVRSYFPGFVNSGYYTCTTESKNECLMRMFCSSPGLIFQAGILTAAGEISFTFMHSEDRALPFAKALQMTECRRATPIKYAAINEVAIGYTDDDKALMPLMPHENLLDKVEGFPQPVPFCGSDSTFGSLMLTCLKSLGCCAADTNYVCSMETMGRNWFPSCPSCCTCGFYPFRLKKDLVVTEYSLITYVRKSRECACGSCCSSLKDYAVVWMSNEMLIGHTLTINATGSENFYTRCWKNTSCGRMCCPIGQSSYNLLVQMDKRMSFNIEHKDNNAHWLGDAGLLKNLRVLDNVQSANYAKDLVASPVGSPMGSPSGSPRKAQNMEERE